jgi:hypothetical protein
MKTPKTEAKKSLVIFPFGGKDIFSSNGPWSTKLDPGGVFK